jgi:isoquinoline 1-oxidoreductase beta subunit
MTVGASGWAQRLWRTPSTMLGMVPLPVPGRIKAASTEGLLLNKPRDLNAGHPYQRDMAAGINRRTLLVGGGVGAGLVLAWGLWPRHYQPNLAVAPGETMLGAFLKIGADGRVTVVVPQAEMGQGIWTALAQALADQLGADWRQIAVEPAPINPLYANRLIAGEAAEDNLPDFLHGVGGWAAREWATRNAFMMTAGSTSIRAFEQPFREAGAFARALLCMAAGKRIGADWQACDTEAGFVVRGNDRFRFGELAAEAAGFTPPAIAPLREIGAGGISGKAMPRLDLPAKVDGSTLYAGDVRLPNMVYASIRHGPLGDTHLVSQEMKAAESVQGVRGVIRAERWIAALGATWWAAEQALNALHPRFATRGPLPDSGGIARALDAALAGSGKRLIAVGDPDTSLAGPGLVEATYEVPIAAHATIEPLVATARVSSDRAEIWAPTQAPGLMRAAVAAAVGLRENAVIVYPTAVGGGFGRKLEVDAAVEAAVLSQIAKRPVQLMWSRQEEMLRARHMPPAKAHLVGRITGGRIAAWRARIAAPASDAAFGERLLGRTDRGRADPAAIDGAVPPYAIANLAIEHVRADIGIATGIARAGAHAYTAFFTECFVDELAAVANQDPLSFRMAQLGHDARLARCLQRAAATGGWSGEPQAGQGLAVHSAFGSHIACMAELEDGGHKVARLVAAVDCGRVINPEIVRQQIESGLAWGLAAAFGDRMTFGAGLAEQHGLNDLKLPRMADMPEITVEIVNSQEAPGGVAELGVPVAIPAIANAIASASGKRLRALPLL